MRAKEPHEDLQDAYRCVGVDSDAVLPEARKLIAAESSSRRAAPSCKRSLTLGGLSLLTGCSISDNAQRGSGAARRSRASTTTCRA